MNSFIDAICDGDLAEVKKVLKSDPSRAAEETLDDGFTPLHSAAYCGRTAIAKLLLQKGASVGAKAHDGYWKGAMPLHMAAYGGHKNVAELLLAHSANAEAVDSLGRTPLHIAVYPSDCELTKGHLAVVELLLTHNANPNAKDRSGRTPLHHAKDIENEAAAKLLQTNGGVAVTEQFNAGFFTAVLKGNVKKVNAMLKTNPSLASSRDDGESPLHKAASEGQVDVVAVLLKANSPVDARDDLGNTPLHKAAMCGHYKVVELLLAHGAEVDALGNCSSTPLNVAAMSHHNKVARILIRNGASVNAKNHNGISPLKWLTNSLSGIYCGDKAEGRRSDDEALAKMLRTHGAYE